MSILEHQVFGFPDLFGGAREREDGVCESWFGQVGNYAIGGVFDGCPNLGSMGGKLVLTTVPQTAAVRTDRTEPPRFSSCLGEPRTAQPPHGSVSWRTAPRTARSPATVSRTATVRHGSPRFTTVCLFTRPYFSLHNFVKYL